MFQKFDVLWVVVMARAKVCASCGRNCIGMESISVVSAYRRKRRMEKGLFSFACLLVDLLLRKVAFCVFKIRNRRDMREIICAVVRLRAEHWGILQVSIFAVGTPEHIG
jgi:hypothetical protein